jgi:hypothetical protein
MRGTGTPARGKGKGSASSSGGGLEPEHVEFSASPSAPISHGAVIAVACTYNDVYLFRGDEPDESFNGQYYYQ